jgi:hypothetical protein
VIVLDEAEALGHGEGEQAVEAILSPMGKRESDEGVGAQPSSGRAVAGNSV